MPTSAKPCTHTHTHTHTNTNKVNVLCVQDLNGLSSCTSLRELSVAGNALGKGNGLRCGCILLVGREWLKVWLKVCVCFACRCGYGYGWGSKWGLCVGVGVRVWAGV